MRVLPNPHFDIIITQLSKGQSAVVGAACQSGEGCFLGMTKNYSGKRGVLYTEIMLPAHAPPEYANREQSDLKRGSLPPACPGLKAWLFVFPGLYGFFEPLRGPAEGVS